MSVKDTFEESLDRFRAFADVQDEKRRALFEGLPEDWKLAFRSIATIHGATRANYIYAISRDNGKEKHQ